MPALVGDFIVGSILVIAGDVNHSMAPDGFALHLQCIPSKPDIFRIVVNFNRGDASPPSISEEAFKVRITCDQTSFAILVNEQVACFEYTRPMDPIRFLTASGNFSVTGLLVSYTHDTPDEGEDQSGLESEQPEPYKISMYERLQPGMQGIFPLVKDGSYFYSTMKRLYPD